MAPKPFKHVSRIEVRSAVERWSEICEEAGVPRRKAEVIGREHRLA